MLLFACLEFLRDSVFGELKKGFVGFELYFASGRYVFRGRKLHCQLIGWGLRRSANFQMCQ